MLWHFIIAVVLGVGSGLGLHFFYFAGIVLVAIILTVLNGYWHELPFWDIAVTGVIVAVALQIGYVVGILLHLTFKRLVTRRAARTTELLPAERRAKDGASPPAR